MAPGSESKVGLLQLRLGRPRACAPAPWHLVSLLLAAAAPAAAAAPLAEGDVCYRFCEIASQPFVGRRADCPQDAPCAPPSGPGAIGFDSCGSRAHVCGGGKAQPADSTSQKQAAGAVAPFLRQQAAKPPAEKAEAPKDQVVAAATPVQEVRSLQQTIDCVADPDNMYCCELEEDAPCLMVSIIKASDGCSIACQRRYQTLGYDCYASYKMHFRFTQMMKNCDPTGAYDWQAPTTTKPPRTMSNEPTGPDKIGVAGAVRTTAGGAGPLSTAIFAATAALLAAAMAH